jgi:hypothetical protein
MHNKCYTGLPNFIEPIIYRCETESLTQLSRGAMLLFSSVQELMSRNVACFNKYIVTRKMRLD